MSFSSNRFELDRTNGTVKCIYENKYIYTGQATTFVGSLFILIIDKISCM